MRPAAFLVSAAFLSVAALAPAFAQDPVPAAPVFTDAQRTEIESIIKDYIGTKHPELIAEAAQKLQTRDQEASETKLKEGVKSFKEKIFNDPNTPVGGNPKGDVTIVEFFDYQCGYCKLSEEGIEKVMKEDKHIRFIYKNFPVLGPLSIEAAKASQAAIKQGVSKFEAFHIALMNKKDHLTVSEPIYEIAKQAGLDVEKLKKDMEDPSIKATLNDNLKLGQDMGVRGTPLFIVGESVFPGAMQYDQLKKSVDAVREKVKK